MERAFLSFDCCVRGANAASGCFIRLDTLASLDLAII